MTAHTRQPILSTRPPEPLGICKPMSPKTATRCRELRRELELTQADLTVRSGGISNSTICRIENATELEELRQVPLDTLIRLAGAMRKSVVEMVPALGRVIRA